MPPRKKLIEVALPLEAINVASAREKSIRHGHPSTLHLWWARRPLAACRAVIFSSLVDDPDSPDALPAFVEACKALPKGPNATLDDTPRMRLFDFIERLVTWEATTDEGILNQARELIQIATEGNPPPLLDPFAGGGSIPLEAQRLGLEAHASDLNPVAVMINKAQIEIPPRFANRPPVNPKDSPSSPALLPPQAEEKGEKQEHWAITPEMHKRMTEIARRLRREATPSEGILWDALRSRKFQGRKFKRQVDIGPFVLDFYCPAERLAVEVDGPIHESQREADQQRQSLIESLDIRFVRLSAELVETRLPEALQRIQNALQPTQSALPLSSHRIDRGKEYTSPLPLSSRSVNRGEGYTSPLPLSSRSVGEGRGEGLWRAASGLAADVRYYGEWMHERAWERIGHLYPKLNGETVIAWIWARTVKSPNPAVNAPVPLVRSFILSKKKGKETWAKPIIEGNSVRFEVIPGTPPPGKDGTVVRTGATCLISGTPISFDYVRAEAKAGRMGTQLMAIVTEGKGGRNYYSPDKSQIEVSQVSIPDNIPITDLPEKALSFRVQIYGMDKHFKLFTPRQLVALTTFSDLVAEARVQAHQDARAAGLADDDIPLRDGGTGARAYAEAVSVYLAFAVDRLAEKCNSLSTWQNSADKIRGIFARQAIAMVWDYADVNPFSGSTGNFGDALEWISQVLESIKIDFISNFIINNVVQRDASNFNLSASWTVISTDPPYYDNIGYADLSDFFYVWMRRNLRAVYPDIFGTMLVPKEPELIASVYRHGGKEAAKEHFENGLHATFVNVRQSTSMDYPLTVYYAFKQQDSESADEDDHERDMEIASSGWETILTSLLNAGFSIDGTWPMRTERGGRTNEIGTNALASSIVLVCRPRSEDAPTISRRQFLEALRREMPAALKNLQSGNIAPVDLAQASIGPGMAVYSRYRKIIEADGSPMSVRTALGLINQELDTFLAEQDGDIDPETRFAVSWFEQFGFKEGEFGVADVLARAKNTSVAGIEASGVVESGRGKVKLRHWKDYDPGAWDPQQDRRPTIWEAVHHLIERLNTHGETGAALLLVKMPHEMAAEARNLAYRLYSICERKSWAENARDYNALVISWAGVGEEAGRVRDAQARNQATEQGRLFE